MMKGNKNIQPSVKKTKDGSNTLYSSRFNQHYHNLSGAVAEGRHVFVDINGLKTTLKSDTEINILEVGFGTGLNLLLLMDEHQNNNALARINYHAIEAWPISPKTFENLDYSQNLNNSEVAGKLASVFTSLQAENNTSNLQPDISLIFFCDIFARFNPGDVLFDFIFHDAFSPEANPELWSVATFEKLLKWSHSQTKLTTYCAASKARGAMAAAGWKVARAPGARGKREMTMATPTADALKSFKRVNEEWLAQRYRENDF